MRATDSSINVVNGMYMSAFRSRVPLACNIELTKRCNFRCPHCYAVPHVGDLATDAVMAAVRQLSDMGCLYFTLTGGEALLHPDFEDICQEIKRNVGIITLFTNGFFLDEKLEFLSEVKPQVIDITVYGASNRTYESFCGVSDGYAKVVSNIEAALSAGLRVSLKMFVTRDNIEDFAAVRSLASGLGVPFRFDSELFPTFKGSPTPKTRGISINDTLLLDLSDGVSEPSGWFDSAKGSSCDDGRLVEKWHSLREDVCAGKLFRCKAGRTSAFITSENRIRMCYMIPTIEFDLAKVSVSEAWDAFGEYVDIDMDISSKCVNCNDYAFCNVCPALLFHESGNFTSPNGTKRSCEIMKTKRLFLDAS